MRFNSLTEIAIYLAGGYRGEEYQQLQHQLNKYREEGTL